MDTEIRDITDEERLEASILCVRATQAGEGAITKVLATVARLAVQAASSENPAAAVRELRTNSSLLTAKRRMERDAQATAYDLITAAVIDGYALDATLRGKLVEKHNPGIIIDVKADKRELREYPILGHTPAEMAVDLATRLSYAIDGALAAPLVGTVDLAGIPAALGEVGRTHGIRLGNAVTEAFFAGVQAATRDLGEAFTNPIEIKKAS